jgi:hypothetical protein
MPRDDSSARDALNHQSLKVSRDDPGPRPMIAVLDAAMNAAFDEGAAALLSVALSWLVRHTCAT